MKRTLGLLATMSLLTATAALAKPPAPIPCPDDVATALGEKCPCDGGPGQAWKNHGGYVSCVVRYRNQLRKSGCLDDTAKRTIAKCAARSTCGKEGAALCCVYDTSGTCSDTVPGDATADGVCSNSTTVCDTAEDCIIATGPTLVRHEERCTDNGGTLVGGGSVCSACPIPPPAP